MGSRANDLPPTLQQDALAHAYAAGGVGRLARLTCPTRLTRLTRPLHAPETYSADKFRTVNGYGDNIQTRVDANGSYFTQPQLVINDVRTPATITGHGIESYLGTNANGSSFTQLHSVADGVFAPTIVTEHGNNFQLGWNTNGFNLTQHQFYPNGVFAPAPVTGHGNEFYVGVNANDSGLTRPQFHANGVFTPTISTFPTAANDQGLFDVTGFANVNGDFNDFSPINNAHGFNHGNNPLPTQGAYSFNSSNNSLPTMGGRGYNYGNDSVPRENNAHGSIFITTPQVTNDVVVPTDPGLLNATPLVSPVDPVAAEPPATAPGSRQTCPVCQKTYGRLSDLKRHATNHRAGPREFGCPARGCRYKGNKGFTRKDKMKDHVKNIHPEIDVRSL